MMAMRSQSHRQTPVAAGFSLVEVTLALGLVAFAVLAIMATIPLGLSTLGDAKDQTVETHILSGLAAKIGTLSFSGLSALDAESAFDGEGQPTTDRDKAVYSARIFAVNPVYAGSPSNPGRALQTVRIVVTNLHRSAALPHSYTVHVAKSQ